MQPVLNIEMGRESKEPTRGLSREPALSLSSVCHHPLVQARVQEGEATP